MKLKAAFAALAVAALAMTGCSVDQSGQQADKPTIRIGYQTFPSGDLIVKNNRWLEEALPDYNIKCSGEGAMADTGMLFGVLGREAYTGRGEQLCDYFPSTGTGQVVVDFSIRPKRR